MTPELMPVLVEALLDRLQDAAMAFEALQLDAGEYREPLERFDSLRRVLDALGWGAIAIIDIDAHRDALLAALAERLRVERHMMADGAESVREGHRGGEAQRERAYRRTLMIETFMHVAGLIPAGRR